MRSPTATRPTSPCSRFPSASRSSAIRTRTWTPRRFARKAARARGERRGGRSRRRALAAALPQDGGRSAARAPSRARSAVKNAAKKPRTKAPLLVVANSPDKEAALAGLERWKSKHPEAAALLAVDDVLVDSMRGRSSTWTRIRVNLRHVPEELRPPQETPDPDDDPTREWRNRRAMKSKSERPVAFVGITRISDRQRKLRQLLRRNDFELGVRAVARLLVRAPPAKLRRVTEAAALHVLVSDFDHQFGTQRLPRQVLALAPAALAARHAMFGFTARWCLLGPMLSRGERRARSCGTARGIRPARGASLSVKLAHTPTCCSAPESSKRPSSSEPTACARLSCASESRQRHSRNRARA